MGSSGILFLGFIASQLDLDAAFRSEKAPQVSAIDFQKGILKAFRVNKIPTYALGSLPIASYPANQLLHVKGARFELPIGVPGRLMGFLNLPVIKLFCRFASSLYYGAKRLKSDPSIAVIVVYSIHLPHLAAALLLKRCFSVRVAAFINDLPIYMETSESRGLFSKLKQFETSLSQRLMRQVDLALPVSPKTATDWLPSDTPFLVVEGIAEIGNFERKTYPKQQRNPRPRLLYAGTLSYVANFAKLFAQSTVDADLVFAGGGPDGDEIAALAARDSRITRLPFLRGQDFEDQIEMADFLVNARDSSWPGGRYSFAYKLFEYMQRGRPILSTRLGGISNEFFECFLAIDDSNISAFDRTLTSALGQPVAELVRRIDVGWDIVAVRKGPEAVGREIAEALHLDAAL